MAMRVFNPPSVDGRQNRTAHLSFAKHILAETWETRFAPGFKGSRTGWWKSPKPNHYFDATYQAIVARSMRGIGVLEAPTLPTMPAVEPTGPARQLLRRLRCSKGTVGERSDMPKLKDEKPERDTVLIKVAIAEVPPATWGLHINTHLTPEQSWALRRIAAALDRRLARLSNGRRVVNHCDALKYLLEQICGE